MIFTYENESELPDPNKLSRRESNHFSPQLREIESQFHSHWPLFFYAVTNMILFIVGMSEDATGIAFEFFLISFTAFLTPYSPTLSIVFRFL
jgi:hypothetical protein